MARNSVEPSKSVATKSRDRIEEAAEGRRDCNKCKDSPRSVHRRYNGREQEGFRFHFQAAEDNCRQRRAAEEAEAAADMQEAAASEAEAEAGLEEEEERHRRRRDFRMSSTPCTAQAAALKEAGRFPQIPLQIPPPEAAKTASGATP